LDILTLFFVRAGWAISKITTGQHRKVGFQPNIGLGFKYKGIQIDYALTDLGNQSAALYSNISLKVDLALFRIVIY
jgi:hypothetical protein